jgi:hypothetical protein
LLNCIVSFLRFGFSVRSEINEFLSRLARLGLAYAHQEQ